MTTLQKVSFCTFTSKKPRFFSFCRQKNIVLAVALICIAILSLHAEEMAEYKEEDGFNYAISLPVHFRKEKKYILGICLHGLGGSGKFMLKDFSMYSRYMNIILACPNGNIPDPSRNATKWGSEESLDYIYSFYEYIRNKYNVIDEPLLIGFSQGANQALYLTLKNPDTFKTVVLLSGGYSEIPKEYFPNVEKLKLLFISGDTGPGEVYTLKKMNERLELLKPYSEKSISQIICKGFIHETNPAYAYKIFHWFVRYNKRYKKDFWINKGDFYSLFMEGESEFMKSNYSDSLEIFKKSLKINPIYPPAVLRYSHSSLLTGKMKSFRKSFFKGIDLYSTDPVFQGSFVSELFEDIRITFKQDMKLRNFFLQKIESEFSENEPKYLPIIQAEFFLLLGHLSSYSERMEDATNYFDSAKELYGSIEPKSATYKDFGISSKLFFLENR